MVHEQKGLCDICYQPNIAHRDLCVDHNHETGRIRGLLCTNCNTGIGLLKENPLILDRAITYLAKHVLKEMELDNARVSRSRAEEEVRWG